MSKEYEIFTVNACKIDEFEDIWNENLELGKKQNVKVENITGYRLLEEIFISEDEANQYIIEYFEEHKEYDCDIVAKCMNNINNLYPKGYKSKNYQFDQDVYYENKIYKCYELLYLDVNSTENDIFIDKKGNVFYKHNQKVYKAKDFNMRYFPFLIEYIDNKNNQLDLINKILYTIDNESFKKFKFDEQEIKNLSRTYKVEEDTWYYFIGRMI
jgi:hypothetical protein